MLKKSSSSGLDEDLAESIHINSFKFISNKSHARLFKLQILTITMLHFMNSKK